MTPPFPPRIIDPTKITGYLLNPDHEIGRAKAAFFARFGFSLDFVGVMEAALLDHPDRNPIDETTIDQWGTRYVVRCSVETPDRRNPCILTVWMVRTGEQAARFVTAYPA